MGAGLLIFGLLWAAGEGAAPPAQLTKLPALIHYVEAPYPEAAAAEGKEGQVVLILDVDTDGLVQRVEIQESSSPEFAEPAAAAAAGFIFSPAEAGELGPVPIRITYRYGFVFRPPPPVATASVTGPGPAPAPEKAAPINFFGTIKESGVRKRVSNAIVEVSITTSSVATRTSTEANEQGEFAFRGLPIGQHVVSIQAPFFQRLDTKEELTLGEALEVLYYLERIERDPYEIVVRDRIPRKEVARRTLQIEEIMRLPGTQGDAIRVIQNLPGVARTPFGLGLLVVRGAPPTDTGVFLDGHRLPILFHFGGIGGLTSVINSRSLQTIEFSPGGFGPQQGRFSAGIVELTSKYAATDRVHANATVDIAGAGVFIEGPVTTDPDDGAFVLSIRRSYIDAVLTGVLSALDSSVAFAPRSFDYQARYDKPLGDRRRMLTLLAYGSDDELIFLGGTTQASGTPDGTQSKTYFHRFNPRYTYEDQGTFFRISPIVGIDYTNSQTTGDPSGNDIRLKLENLNAGFRVDAGTPLSKNLTLKAGGDLLYYYFVTDSVLPALPATKDFPSPLPTDVPLRRDSATVPAVTAALYAEFEVQLTDKLTLYPGLRFDLYDFSAEPGPLIDERLIDGRTAAGIDPRLTIRYQLLPELSLKGQAGLYGQPPQPTQFYVNADLPLLDTQQYSAGFEWDIFKELSLDIQGFFRFQNNVPRFTNQTEVVDGEVRVVGFTPDSFRRAYGMELLLKLQPRWGLSGWIAYTLSRGEFRRAGRDWQANFVFDQTHNLNLVGTYELALNWHLSARFRYVTGGGLPATNARWYDADRDQYARSVSQVAERTPAFHQLDIRIDKQWVYDEWSLEVYLDIQNIYNRANTEFFAPTFDFKRTEPIPSLPFLPLIGLEGRF